MTLHLTFDDGPSEWTPQILDLLAEHDVKATFFVIGAHIEGNEGILLRADYEGHAIGNHTWSHPRMIDVPTSQAWVELERTCRAISAITGTWPAAWRAPYYATDDRIGGIADTLGLIRHVKAQVIPEDCFTDDADLIYRRVMTGGEGIVSLHDGIPPGGGSSACTKSRQPTVDAVRMILEGLP